MSRLLQSYKVGLIGAGKVGLRIAERFLEAGLRIAVCDNDEDRLAECCSLGATCITNPANLATECNVVFLSLPTPESVMNVVLGQDGLLSAGHRELVIVDLSTNSPDVVQRIGKVCKAHGYSFLDAPLTGGIVGAEHGTFTIMIGGEAKDVERVRPVLELFTSKIVHVGPQGHGAAVKLLHNMLGELQVYAIAEAFCLAAKLYLDLDKVYEVLSHGMATSRILTELYARGGFRRRFEASATVDTAAKDQQLLLNMARKVNVNLTFSPIVYEKIEELRRRGFGNMDVTSAILLFEERYGVVVYVNDDALRE